MVTNIAKGEKLKNKDLWTMQDRKALYIKQDGSKEELGDDWDVKNDPEDKPAK